MKKTHQLKKLIIAAVLSTFIFSSYAQVGIDMETLVNDFQAAYNRGDNQALGRMFTSNAVRVNQDGSTISGSKRIAENYGNSFSTSNLQNQLTITEIKEESDTRVIVIGTYNITGTAKLTGDAVASSGTYENIFIKENAVWKISRMRLLD